MFSVVIPTLNEAGTISELVRFVRRNARVCEVIVVDDGSIDGTPALAIEAGARVIPSSLLGKGASMEEGMRAARSEIIIYLDGDLEGLQTDLIDRLVAPLVDDDADFVKAKFSRAGGRVTALTAKPLLQIFFPELSGFDQPLGGIVAARKSVLSPLQFEVDYGADIGLFIDVWARGARVKEVEIGRIEHDSQPLDKLGEMASQVVRTIFDRAMTYKRFSPRLVRARAERERRTEVEFEVIQRRIGQPQRIALIDMDRTLIRGRFVLELARRIGKTGQLSQFLDHPTLGEEDRTREIARIFAGTSLDCFQQTANSLPLAEGAVDLVVGLKRQGYRVGIVTDSYHNAADVIRRRVFCDFTVAHVMKFVDGFATGELLFSPAMSHDRGCSKHAYCKSNVMLHLSERIGLLASDFVAIGDGLNDVCLLQGAGQSFAVNTRLREVQRAARHSIHGNLAQILPLLAGCSHLRSGLEGSLNVHAGYDLVHPENGSSSAIAGK
jgi:glucosyl-3-phosphoglycerate synthase